MLFAEMDADWSFLRIFRSVRSRIPEHMFQDGEKKNMPTHRMFLCTCTRF